MFDKDNDGYLNKSEFFVAYEKLIESDVITDEEFETLSKIIDKYHKVSKIYSDGEGRRKDG